MFFKVDSQEAREKAFTYIHFCRLLRRDEVKKSWIEYRDRLEKKYKTKKWWAGLLGLKVKPFDIPEYSEAIFQSLLDKKNPLKESFEMEMALFEKKQGEISDLVTLIEETGVPYVYLEKSNYHPLFFPNRELYKKLSIEFSDVEKITE